VFNVHSKYDVKPAYGMPHGTKIKLVKRTKNSKNNPGVQQHQQSVAGLSLVWKSGWRKVTDRFCCVFYVL